MKSFIRKMAMPLVRVYWRLFKPNTFGVKLLLQDSSMPGTFLLVRHSYGDQFLWNLPGGGYNPKRELPIEAALREAKEELSVVVKDLKILGLYNTSTEGKNDSVTIVGGFVARETIKSRDEISKVRWVDKSSMLADQDVAKVAKYGVELLKI